jgi:ribosome-associated protein
MSSRPPHRDAARPDKAAAGGGMQPGDSPVSPQPQSRGFPAKNEPIPSADFERFSVDRSRTEHPATDKPSTEAFAVGGTEIGPGVFVGPRGIRMQNARGSGPGGQNVNKVNTKVEIWIDLSQVHGLNSGAMARLREAAGYRLTDSGELHVASDTHRTQGANRAAVFQRLREMIVAALVQPKRRRKTKPTRASKRKRLESKRHRGEIKAGRRGTGE